MTDNIIGIHARRRPTGTFRAVSCRDGSSLDRDGQPYYDLNHFDTSDCHPLCEVRFADGMWLLADPAQDLVPGFVLDYDPTRVYLAHSYGPTWNGCGPHPSSSAALCRSCWTHSTSPTAGTVTPSGWVTTTARSRRVRMASTTRSSWGGRSGRSTRSGPTRRRRIAALPTPREADGGR